MKNFITGHSYPLFKIYNGNTYIEDISLNLCGVDGLKESYESFGVKHELLSFTTVTKWKGMHINFKLSYSEYSNKDNSLKIMKLLNYIINGYKIILYPRADILSRSFEVIFVGEPFELGIMKGGLHATGNKLITLSFKTKYLQTSINWVDPDNISTPVEFVVAT